MSKPKPCDVPDRLLQGMEVPEPLGHDARPVKVDLLLERFRDQLLSLARLKIRPQLQARIDLSGVVQQTLLEANLSAPPVQIDDSQAVVGWLKRLLARKLIDAMRWHFAIKRDVRRERPMTCASEGSSVFLTEPVVAEQSSPSRRMIRAESIHKLRSALRDLPEDQRQVLELHYLEGMSLQQLSLRLDRSPSAIAGLLARGMRTLRRRFALEG